ncbi:MAG: heavy metal-responsive transcriptional regulator [Gemmatimonadaceae bacterium]|nr:heavy metal-responsive transcriptional regulator [Gemmatimonadaceae bacterium]NUR33923.1 heavy metal-responsive transcriptional regulator [Gemmatimonadaceae bacterium]
MRIGEVATNARVSVETLRYYERRGLLPNPERSASGYRSYGPDTVRRVRFVRHAQQLGFTLDEIADLLGMWEDSATSCEQVADRAAATLTRIDAKMEQLARMRVALAKYVSACHAHETLADCPLLVSLGRLED